MYDQWSIQNKIPKKHDYNFNCEPNYANFWGNRGRFLFYHLKKYECAIKDFDKAIKLKPKDARFWLGRGKCKVNLEKYECAIKDLDQAIVLDPEEKENWFVRAGCKFFFRAI